MHLVPHVAIGGTIARPLGAQDAEHSYTFEPVGTHPVVEAAVSGLLQHSSTSGSWLPGGQRLHIKTVAALDLPKKTVPSILSPKNPASELYPDKVFTSKWVEKYTEHIPTTVVMFVELDSNVEQQLEAIRYALRAARSHIIVVAIASDFTDLNARLATLRRNTGLAPKTELICLRTDASQQELAQFDDAVWPLLQAHAADFFAARSRETRHKRAQNETDMALWEARYTLKLAFFAEFKADYDGAIRLYQSAYDCLQGLDSDWLDTCVQKMVLFLLYYQRYNQAYAKFKLHINRSSGSSKKPDWLAQQYLDFAKTLSFSVVEKWAVSPDDDPLVAVPRPGFLALTAAKLATQPTLKQQAFDLALKDLAAFPNCKATVLHAMGEWRGDDSSEYEEALRVLPATSRRFERFSTGKTPLAQFHRYLQGKAELPTAPLGAINMPLYKAAGCFVSETAFVGKPLQCQLTLTPLYDLPFEVAVKVQFNCASHTLTATLSEPRTFDFEIKPSEVGECEFVDIQVHSQTPQFDQRLMVQAADCVVTPSGPRHKHIVPQRSIEVHARPQLLGIDTAQVPAVLYSEESTSVQVAVLNNEDEVAAVEVEVHCASELVYSTTVDIDPHDTATLTFPLATPRESFSLEVGTTYTTPGNQVPVSHSVTADVQVVRPFQVNFSLSPKLHTEAWPNVFVPSDQCGPLPLIRRRWMLGAKVMSMCHEPVEVVARTFVCTSAQASITALHTRLAMAKSLEYNESVSTDVNFEAMRKDRDLRSFEAEGELVIEWRRGSGSGPGPCSDAPLCKYTVPKVRVSLPNQEPRVLLDARNDGNTGRIELSYLIENATSHTLNFAVSMGSSRYFSLHGPKATTARVLPFSRHRIEYCLYPVCDPLNKQLPELRVFDTTYKKVLPVVSDSGSVYCEDQKLFLRTFSPPL